MSERQPLPKVQRPGIPFVTLLRMFLLGSVAVVACIYAIWRHYTVPHVRMLVPATPASSVSASPSSSSPSEIEIEP